MHCGRSLTLLVAGALLAAGCGDNDDAGGTARVDPRCDGHELPVIASGGVGLVRVGMPVSTLARHCKVTDTSVVLAEGLPERAHIVQMGSHRLLTISTGTADTSIVRIIVTDSAFRTAQGLGVGSTLGEMRELYKVLSYSSEEQRSVTIPSVPGIAFGYEAENVPDEPAHEVSVRPDVLDQARVTKLWLFEAAPR
jgi:hypothetical protein